MAKKEKGYFGLPWIVCVVLAIFPFTAWLCGTVVRFQRGNLIGGLLALFGMLFGILWICDIVTIILNKDITVLA